MWIVMMAAMMLPSLVPMLWRCLAERFESSARTPFFFPGRLDISATRLQVGK
jgi:predicted metal-binding membrane protein